MTFYVKDVDTLLKESVITLQERSNISRFTPGSKAQSILLSMNRQLGYQYKLLDINMFGGFIIGATNKNLDMIGELLGTPRKQSTKAISDKASKNALVFTDAPNFGSINGGNDIFLPDGTIVKTRPVIDGEPTISYRISDPVVLPAGENQYYVSVESVASGSSSSVAPGTLVDLVFTDYTDYSNKSLKITNISGIQNGQDVEKDDDYRYRLLNTSLANEAANETAIRLAALSVPGVSDVTVSRYSRGIGTADLVLLTQHLDLTNDLVSTVQLFVSEATGIGNSVRVRAPEYIGLETYVTYAYVPGTTENEKKQIEQNSLLAYKNFLLNLPLGTGMPFNALIGLLNNDSRILNMGQPNKPIDDVFVYQSFGDERIKKRLFKDLAIASDQKIVPEYSVQPSLIIRRK